MECSIELEHVFECGLGPRQRTCSLCDLDLAFEAEGMRLQQTTSLPHIRFQYPEKST